ncbi:MAG TPA: transketolase [Alcanivoracaceae bacterium]|nr:transketolase [Alcanivoracaceae bacterium]
MSSTSLGSRHLANAIRALSMDAVQKANSGHPGAPMGMADIAEVLWRGFLSHNPNNPQWPNRDRFVLSNGHGSMLLYSLLHLTGYDVSLEDIKNFRQLHSPTAGHPEYMDCPGVETTTGPLGQGIANAVGMALTEKMLAQQFNRDGYEVVDHYTYTFLGDGCLMEGISHEACSLAGTLGLDKLIVFWDDNGISIDGNVEGWFTDNTVERFRAYGWHVIPNVDGHNADEIRAAIENAQEETGKPTLICCRTTIGFGSPAKAGTADSHGAPLGDDEIVKTKAALNWEHGPFEVPADIYEAWDAKQAGARAEAEWQIKMNSYEAAFPELAAELKRRLAGELPADFLEKSNAYIAQCQADKENVATRKASENALNAYGPLLPELVGGSADLGGSNNTVWKGSKAVTASDMSGNYVHYGVREFAMTAMMNGMSLYGGVRPYAGTFLVFMEYARNAVRMAALMKQPTILVYTHDSIGLGEDGPTHQPIEQLASLRTTPNLSTWRPCDTVETAVAWQQAILRQDGPSALIFSRQGLPCMDRTDEQLGNIARGGYVLMQTGEGEPEAILLATGSEVQLAVAAAQQLGEQGRNVRVVSLPAVDVFLAQDAEYQEDVLPHAVRRRVAVEASWADYWKQFVGLDGKVIGMRGFGASAPINDLYQHFGITTEAVVEATESLFS